MVTGKKSAKMQFTLLAHFTHCFIENRQERIFFNLSISRTLVQYGYEQWTHQINECS